MRNDDAVTRGRQPWSDVDIGVDVVRPAVQQDDGLAVTRPRLGVSDTQLAGIDLFEHIERGSARIGRRG